MDVTGRCEPGIGIEAVEGINRILQSALTSQSPEELGKVCIEVALALTHSQYGFIGEVGDDGFLHDIAISEVGWDRCSMRVPEGHHRVPGPFRTRGFYAEVMANEAPLIANDPASRSSRPTTPQGHPSLSALLGVPLKEQGRTFGTMVVANKPEGYCEEDARSLGAIAPAIVQAFKRSSERIDREKAEEALRRSEERFRSVLENALDAAYRRDLIRDCYDYMSPVIKRITGFTAEEFSDLPVTEVLDRIHPDDLDRVYSCLAEADRTGDLECDYRFRRKDGDYVWMSDNARLIFDDSGAPVFRSGVVRDVTRRKRDEEELRESAARTSLLKEVAAASASSLNVGELAQRVLDVAHDLLGASVGIVYVAESDERASMCAQVGHEGVTGFEDIVADDQTLGGMALSTGEMQWATADELPPEAKRRAGSVGMTSHRVVAAPILARAHIVGVVLLGFPGMRGFRDDELNLYRAVADQMSAGLEKARLYQEEHSIAETLQETLVVLPSHIAGVSFSRAYESATYAIGRVGGDFIDIFEVREGLVGIALGDVSGKGIEAAVTTSLVRNTLRIHAVDGLAPAAVMAKANGVIRRFTEVESFVTMWFGLLSTESGFLRYGCAGHPPVFVIASDGTITELECRDAIMGAFDEADYHESRFVMETGDRLFLYSDGATEARSPEGGFLGKDGLRDLVSKRGAEPSSRLSIAVMEDVTGFSGGVLRDDVAMLTVEANNITTRRLDDSYPDAFGDEDLR